MAQIPKRPVKTSDSIPMPRPGTGTTPSGRKIINENNQVTTTSSVLTPKVPGGNNNQ